MIARRRLLGRNAQVDLPHVARLPRYRGGGGGVVSLAVDDDFEGNGFTFISIGPAGDQLGVEAAGTSVEAVLEVQGADLLAVDIGLDAAGGDV
ncbi:hypothetical protein MOCA_24350 [Moorella thermoacetica]|nr:hypothetical protein MOCA_24350 [Moorella thermoacetica]